MSTRSTLKQGQLSNSCLFVQKQYTVIFRQFREMEKTGMASNHELKNDIFSIPSWHISSFSE